MLIVGAKGFAKEVLEIFHQQGKTDKLAFYDDINKEKESLLFNQYPILQNENEVRKHFAKFGNEFTIGIGNPILRFWLYKKFLKLGGVFTSAISPLAHIGSHNVNIGNGSNILQNSIFSNNTNIGKGCIVYYNSIITHDCFVEDFVEISPSVNILGNCRIRTFSHLGANATILPNLIVGSNVVVGAGAVVTKNVPDNSVVVGVPAKVIRRLKPLKMDYEK